MKTGECEYLKVTIEELETTLTRKAKDFLFKMIFTDFTNRSDSDKEETKISFYEWLNKINRRCFFGDEEINKALDEMRLGEIKTFFIGQLKNYYRETYGQNR